MIKIVKVNYKIESNTIFIQNHPYLLGQVCPPCFARLKNQRAGLSRCTVPLISIVSVPKFSKLSSQQVDTGIFSLGIVVCTK
jgi:hypothetical protein